MYTTTINGQAVEVCVINTDGTEAAGELEAEELAAMEKLDARCRDDAGFAQAYKEARLVRIDSNRGLGDQEEGRFYLRYQHKGGMAEFWGNEGEV